MNGELLVKHQFYFTAKCPHCNTKDVATTATMPFRYHCTHCAKMVWANVVVADGPAGFAVVKVGSEAHYSLKEAGWAETDFSPSKTLVKMEW
jgi:hypothetical protein